MKMKEIEDDCENERKIEKKKEKIEKGKERIFVKTRERKKIRKEIQE